MHCILFPIGNASSRTKFNFVSWKIRKLEQVEILKLWRPITRKLSGGARGPSDAERLSRYTLSLKRQWVVLFVLWNTECYLYICNLHEKCDWFCTRSGVLRRRNWHRRSNVYLYIILRQWLILIGILQIMFEIYIYIYLIFWSSSRYVTELELKLFFSRSWAQECCLVCGIGERERKVLSFGQRKMTTEL